MSADQHGAHCILVDIRKCDYIPGPIGLLVTTSMSPHQCHHHCISTPEPYDPISHRYRRTLCSTRVPVSAGLCLSTPGLDSHQLATCQCNALQLGAAADKQHLATLGQANKNTGKQCPAHRAEDDVLHPTNMATMCLSRSLIHKPLWTLLGSH